VPKQILTGNGKVFTARFGRGPGPVMFDRICAGNGIRHLLTAPHSPTTTGKVERLHKTMRAEFFTPRDGTFATIPELQAALDGCGVVVARSPADDGDRNACLLHQGQSGVSGVVKPDLAQRGALEQAGELVGVPLGVDWDAQLVGSNA
jgi:transposase InsO family protein